MDNNEMGIGRVKVDKAALLEILKKNRETHHADFKEALEQWRGKAMRAVNDFVDRIEKGGKAFRIYSELPVPEQHLDDYNRAIKMLEMHQGESIEMTETAFRRLVDDDWGWKRSFATNTLSYTSKAAADYGDDWFN